MKPLYALLCGALLAPCALLHAADDKAEWITLFNGKDLTGWRGYQAESAPTEGWSVEDGVLHCTGKARVDIITEEKYGEFELMVEWKTVENGNSGILILVDESPKKIWNHSPEIQIFDSTGKENGLQHKAGAIYDLYPTNPEAIKPAGEWNDMRITLKDKVLTVTLNGKEASKAVLGSDEWNAKIAESKFNKYPQFAKNEEGHIGIQDHGQEFWIKTVKIRKL